MAEDEKKLTNVTTDMIVAVAVLLVALSVLGVYLVDIADAYQRILEWFYSRNWDAVFPVLKIILVIVDLMLIGFAVFTLRQYSKLLKTPPPASSEAPVRTVQPQEEVSKNWEYIRELANSKNPSDWNMAILRADALLDDVLMHLGYEGTTLAERLKIVDLHKLPSMEQVWSAHRLRNMIAHDPLEQHTRETIIHTLRSYEQAFRELGMFSASPPVAKTQP